MNTLSLFLSSILSLSPPRSLPLDSPLVPPPSPFPPTHPPSLCCSVTGSCDLNNYVVTADGKRCSSSDLRWNDN